MAFIFGIIDFNHTTINSEEIKLLCEAVQWENFTGHYEVENNIAIGYTSHQNRKAKAGIFKHKELTILADIRIYNSDELSNHFAFDSPEEAFCKAYLKWGLDCTNYINGDFAVMLFDKNKQEVHLFRDHIGVRPLTYCFQNNRLVFASHEFGVAKSKLVETSICEKRFLADFLKKQLDYRYSIFEGIKKVNPGCAISINKQQEVETKVWHPERIKTNKLISYDAAVLQARSLLVNATKERIQTGKIGVHVSGGLDCTGVAAILADLLSDKHKLVGYSWSPQKLNTVDTSIKGGNEKLLIDEFAKVKGIEVKYRSDDDTNLFVDSLDAKFRNMSIEHTTMRMAADDDVESIFTGWGGDEFISLSTRGVYNHLFFSLKWFTLLKTMSKHSIKGNFNKFRTDIIPSIFPQGWISVYRDWKKEKLVFVNADLLNRNRDFIYAEKQKNIFGRGNRRQFVLNLLYKRHLSERMDSWTLYGEQYGIEYKYPLLDKKLLEFIMSLPVEFNFKDNWSRGFYREVMKDILPDCIRLRTDKSENLRIQDSARKRKEQSPLALHYAAQISNENIERYFNIIEFEKTLELAKKGFKPAMLIPYVHLNKIVDEYLS